MSSTAAAPGPADLADRLAADAYWHLIRALRATLPPPPGDTAEDRRCRDHAAIATIAALAPGDTVEAELAAQFVAASEQWKDCLRLIQLPDVTPAQATQCRAQALAMMRQANGVLRQLERMQDARRRLEADPAACERRARIGHAVAARMAAALAQPEPAAPPAAEPAAGAGAPGEEGAAAVPDWVLAPDLVAAAERYAATYPERAASTRRTGKMPHDEVRYFDPPEAALCETLIAAQTPALVALDQAFAQPGAA
jgi:hypothetical protein